MPLNNHANKNITLKQLMPTVAWEAVGDIAFTNFCLDSRHVQPNSAFILLKSATNHDDAKSFNYAKQASKTACFILSEIDLANTSEALAHTKDSSTKHENISIPWFYMPNIRDFLGKLQQDLLFFHASNNKPEQIHAQESKPKQPPKPNVIAITGTNGKTTTASLTAQMLKLVYDALNSAAQENANYKVAVLGTIGNGIFPKLETATHTTANVLEVQKKYVQYTQAGADVFCIEASSHGLHQKRLQGMPITTAVYTNLSRDHLDYHKDMQDYAEAKAMLFGWEGLQYAIINADDDYAGSMVKAATETKNHSLKNRSQENSSQENSSLKNGNPKSITVWQYSTEAQKQNKADFFVKHYQPHITGVNILLSTPFGDVQLQSPLLGMFNIANLVAAVAATLAQILQTDDSHATIGHSYAKQSTDAKQNKDKSLTVDKKALLNTIAQVVPKLLGAKGRMQSVSCDSDSKNTLASHAECNYIVDYAHTPDALKQAIASLRAHQTPPKPQNSTKSIAQSNSVQSSSAQSKPNTSLEKNSRLIVVFGCGGDRDRGKRPLMTQAALTADKVIITSDNPRTENVTQIIADMLAGLTPETLANISIEPDRKLAINMAINMATQGDMVLVAGKGHETYQEIQGVRHDFDDTAVIKSLLQAV